MQNDNCVLLILCMLLTAGTTIRAAGSDLESDVQYLMEVDDFLHEEIVAKRQRVISQGERLYPIIRKKLSETSDSMAVSRLLSMVVDAPGEKSKILPAIRGLVESKAARKDTWILVHVALTLGKIGGEADVPVLLDLSRHSEERVRINAARALGQIAGPQVIRKIEQILQKRAAGLSGEQIRKDYSFLEGYLAIARIQHRALMNSAPQK